MKVKNEDGYRDIEGLESRLSDWRGEAEDYLSDWHPEAEEDVKFIHGHQWGEADAKVMEGVPGVRSKRPMVTFNRIAAIARATYGAMVHNQMEISYVRRTGALSKGQGVAKDEVLSSGGTYFRSQPIWNAASEERDMFMDVLGCGIGCMQMIIDDETTGEVEPVGRRVDPFCVGWDTRATRGGLTDRRWHFYKTSLSEQEVVDEFGKVPSKDEVSNQGRGTSTDARPGIRSEDGYEIYHWQWFETEKYFKVLVPDEKTGGAKEGGLTAKEMKALVEGVDYVFADDDRTPRRRRVYWECFAHGDKVLRINKIGVNAFTYEFATGIRDQSTGMWYGLVRDAKDPQRWANKFLSLFIENVAFSGRGVIVEEDAFDDPQEAQRDWADVAKMTIARPGAVSGGKIMPKPENKLPPSADKILEFSTAAVREVLGVPLEQIAQQMNDQSGVVEESRKTAAMAVVAWAFASHRDYLHRHGHLLLRFMTTYIPRGRLIRTVSPDGAATFVPFTYEEATYEVEVDEVPTSPNKKAEVHRTLVAYAPLLQQPEIPASFKTAYLLEMMRSSSIPTETVRRLEAAAAKPPDPMAVQAQQIQMASAMQEVEKLRAQVVELQSQAMLNLAKARGEGQDAETAQRIAATEIKQKVVEGNFDLALKKQKADLDRQSDIDKLQVARERNSMALEQQYMQQQIRAQEPPREERE